MLGADHMPQNIPYTGSRGRLGMLLVPQRTCTDISLSQGGMSVLLYVCLELA